MLVENVSLIDMGRVWVEHVDCVGTEEALRFCTLRYGQAQCSHSDDVIVWCDTGTAEQGTGMAEVVVRLGQWVHLSNSMRWRTTVTSKQHSLF